MGFQHGGTNRSMDARASFQAQPRSQTTRGPRPGSMMAGQAPVGYQGGALASLGGRGDLDEMLSVGLLGLAS